MKQTHLINPAEGNPFNKSWIRFNEKCEIDGLREMYSINYIKVTQSNIGYLIPTKVIKPEVVEPKITKPILQPMKPNIDIKKPKEDATRTLPTIEEEKQQPKTYSRRDWGGSDEIKISNKLKDRTIINIIKETEELSLAERIRQSEEL